MKKKNTRTNLYIFTNSKSVRFYINYILQNTNISIPNKNVFVAGMTQEKH